MFSDFGHGDDMRQAPVHRWFRALPRALALILLSFAIVVQPAAAQSLLRDAETEALFADMSRPLVIAAGLEPGNVKVVLLQDPEINAFVAGGQIVYIHSGLMTEADRCWSSLPPTDPVCPATVPSPSLPRA